jgi:hypothetical protein
MARVKGPLLSLSASGNFRGLMEFRTGGGTTVVCGTRTPPGYRTPNQRAQAERFRQAKDAWNGLTALERAGWRDAAIGTGLSGYKLFLSEWFTQRITPPGLPVPPA